LGLGFGEWREGFWEGSKRGGDKGFAGSHFLGLGEILLGSSYRGGEEWYASGASQNSKNTKNTFGNTFNRIFKKN
jgi:hypothetical protein